MEDFALEDERRADAEEIYPADRERDEDRSPYFASTARRRSAARGASPASPCSVGDRRDRVAVRAARAFEPSRQQARPRRRPAPRRRDPELRHPRSWKRPSPLRQSARSRRSRRSDACVLRSAWRRRSDPGLRRRVRAGSSTQRLWNGSSRPDEHPASRCSSYLEARRLRNGSSRPDEQADHQGLGEEHCASSQQQEPSPTTVVG